MTLAAQITQLIDGVDNFEIVREQIAAILVVESAAQQAKAEAADKNSALWKLRVFIERSNPWEEFVDSAGKNVPEDTTPVVNVSFDNASFDKSASNVVARQKTTGTYHIDCYGFGVSRDDGGDGHIPGDEDGALEAQRAFRLVRRILMAGTYTYLGFTRGNELPAGQEQIVWGRWPRDVQMFQPQIGDRPVAHVVAARFALQVDFSEFSPQVEGQPLELLSLVFTRPTGEVILRAEYPAV